MGHIQFHILSPYTIVTVGYAARFGLLYTTQRGSTTLPRELPERSPEYDDRLPFTLFHQEYLTVVIDEAQGLRNLGVKHLAAIHILQQAQVRLILTATPLQMSTKVRPSAAQLTYFSSKDSLEHQANDNSRLRRAKIDRGSDLDCVAEDDDPVKLAQVAISQRLAARFENRVI